MSEHKYPSQLAERFQIRMPDGLRDQIRDAAETNNRSMNAEIIARLEASFTSPSMPPEFYAKLLEMAERQEDITARIRALEDKKNREGQLGGD